MNERLKACPFCGGENVRLGCSGGFWSVACGTGILIDNGCGASSGLNNTKEGAVEDWNRRHSTESPS